jgi:hypothetical protein
LAASHEQNREFCYGSPFDLGDSETYQRWRDRKLSRQPARAEDIVVEVASLDRLNAPEHAAILDRCRRANMAIYASRDSTEAASELTKDRLRRFGAAFGLRRLDSNLCADEDGITALEVREGGTAGEYIPYSNRPLSWHSDGYYNATEEQVRAVILHCARPAAEGGANALMDPDIAYIRLRDKDPAFIAALMHPEALTIPANTLGGKEIRPARTGPVFSLDPKGALHMRYSARKVNVAWRNDPATAAAVDFLNRLLAEDGANIMHWRLEAGQGYIGNNVLHNRSAFRDEPAGGEGRLIYRARFFDRIDGTEPWS